MVSAFPPRSLSGKGNRMYELGEVHGSAGIAGVHGIFRMVGLQATPGRQLPRPRTDANQLSSRVYSVWLILGKRDRRERITACG